MIVLGKSQLVENQVSVRGDALTSSSAGDMIKWVPGATISRNGPLTALPQYRGSSGDRVNVAVDGMTLFAGGPNIMDAPVSSVPSANIKKISVSRGIASVSVAQETLGGHVEVSTHKGRFADNDELSYQLRAVSLYNTNGDGLHTGLFTALASKEHKAGLIYSYQEGDDHKAGNRDEQGGLSPNTLFERKRVDAFYGVQGAASSINLQGSHLKTENTGTAALPMDILFIDADTAHLDSSFAIADWQVSAMVGSQDIEHGMDNFSLRANATPDRYRSTYATGKHEHGKLMFNRPLPQGYLNMGVDYSSANHDADISNPNNAMFALVNFNQVEKTLAGVYAEWVVRADTLSWELGIRNNYWHSDAGQVSGPMMVAPLAQYFNSQDRQRNESTVDVIAKLAYPLSTHYVLSAAIARKNRAPSYQELYLWAPLESTGGLADGRSYIGNIELDSETAHELNLGLDITHRSFSASAQLFYREVDNYVQGTSTISSPLAMQINMLATTMSANPALQFNNVDARLYGGDVSYQGTLFNRGYYRGQLSYVRGKRSDVDDNLYRIAPLHHRLTVGAKWDKWDISLSSEAVAKQSKVSSFNEEQKTPGYALLGVDIRWQAKSSTSIVIGLDNIFDKYYEQHLNGYNRVAESDIPVGERLPGIGRSLRIGLSVNL